MSIHADGQRGHFICEQRQRCGVAFSQLSYAPGERLRDAVQFALHGSDNGGQPFVVHHEKFDFVHGELGVFLVGQQVKFFIIFFDPGSEGGLPIEKFEIADRGAKVAEALGETVFVEPRYEL